MSHQINLNSTLNQSGLDTQKGAVSTGANFLHMCSTVMQTYMCCTEIDWNDYFIAQVASIEKLTD